MSEATKTNKSSKNKKLGVIIAFVMLIAVVFGVVLFVLNQNNQLPFVNTSAEEEIEAEELVVKVGKLIKLPDGIPEIATVSDVAKLKDQSIFKNAVNGDKVLIYGTAKKAIVYRPSENIIIEVGNLVVNPQAPSTGEEQAEAEEALKVVIINGTSTAGLAGRMETDLEEKFTNIEIIDTGNAINNYEKTIIVDVTGNNSKFAKTLADELNAEVDSLPDGEEEVEADILVIIGG